LRAGLDPEFGVASQVEAGSMRDEAFEATAREALADGGDGAALVADHGLSRIGQVVAQAHGRLRAMGASATDLCVEDASDAAVLLEEAIAFRKASASSLGEHPKPSATLTCVVDGCHDAVAELEALREWTGTPADLVREILRIERLHRPRGNVGKAAKPLLDEVKADREVLLGRLVCAASAAGASALVKLVRDFDVRYAAAKAERGLLDFEDLQLGALALLERYPEMARSYREAFRMVMVDEFQDTNAVQTRVADLLGGDALCTVGDDKQSIYGFRYADVEAYLAHSERMLSAGALPVSFARNFRSHRAVLDLVNQVFGSEALFGGELMPLEHGRDESTAPAWPDDVPRLQAVFVDGAERVRDGRRTEADEIARRLRDLVDHGVPAGGMVLLLRALTNADVYAQSLAEQGLDSVVSAGGAFFDRPEVEAVLAMLRVVVNARDDEAAFGFLASGMAGVSDDGLLRLRLAGGDTSAFEAAGRAGLSPADAAVVGRAAGAVASAKGMLGRAPLGEMIVGVCEQLDYDLHLLARGAEGRRAYANVLKLVRLASEHERSSGGGPAAFLEHLELRRRFDDRESPAAVADEGAAVVRIMSIHAAKGLEFPVVAVADLGRAIRPATDCFALDPRVDGVVLSLALPGNEKGIRPEERQTALFRELRERMAERELAEEKRLFYVACTRAREALILSGAVGGRRDPGDAAQCAIEWLRQGLHVDGAPQAGETTILLDTGTVVNVSTVSAEKRPETARAAESPPERSPAAVPPPQEALTSGIVAPLAAAVPVAIAPTVPKTVSYSDISLFSACPLRYHVERVARLGMPEKQGHGARELGNAVHAALTLVRDGAPPSGERLEAIAGQWGLDEESTRRLRDAVAAFSRSGSFRLAYGRGADPLHEVPFAVPVAGTLLIGSMDLLLREGRDALVVDYKTGNGDVEHAETRYRAQADCYALAALAGGSARVELRFVGLETSVDGLPAETVFSYTEADAPLLRRELEAAVKAMSAGPHGPRDTYDRGVCGGCAAAGRICPLKPRSAD
jgi:ATP-dependent helicase/nuclease subunit A